MSTDVEVVDMYEGPSTVDKSKKEHVYDCASSLADLLWNRCEGRAIISNQNTSGTRFRLAIASYRAIDKNASPSYSPPTREDRDITLVLFICTLTGILRD